MLPEAAAMVNMGEMGLVAWWTANTSSGVEYSLPEDAPLLSTPPSTSPVMPISVTKISFVGEVTNHEDVATAIDLDVLNTVVVRTTCCDQPVQIVVAIETGHEQVPAAVARSRPITKVDAVKEAKRSPDTVRTNAQSFTLYAMQAGET